MVVDGVEARSSARPETAEALAAMLREAAGESLQVTPLGGGRAIGMGNPPARVDLLIETTGLDRVVDFSPHDLTVTVEAGIGLDALQAELAKARQFLPLDPFGGPGHTVGGLLASGWSGPLRLRYGTARDYLVGLRVALPDGKLARSGGRVVKNVSGYDLNKLHLGALGTLGVIVEASFKLYPAPLFEATVRRDFAALEPALAEAARALELAMPPVALELIRDDAGFSLAGRVSGSREGARRIVGELDWEPAPAAFWDAHSRRCAATWARLSVRRGSLPALLRRLPGAARWIAQPGVGVVHWLDPASPAEFLAARTAVENEGGSAVLLAAPVEFKQAADAWGAPPPTIDLMRRLRAAFDPGQTINRGRYLV